MAPEQASGGAVDARTDVYALGATLYAVLTGHAPFEGASEVNVLNAVLTKAPASPRAHDPKIARELEAITLRCLAKFPADRYSSAGAVADDLDRFLAGERISVEPRTGSKVAVAVGACVAATAAVVTTALFVSSRRPPEPLPVVKKEDPPVDAALARAEGLAREAEGHLLRGDVDTAIGAATKAIGVRESVALAWCLRGQAYAAKGEDVNALADLGRALEKDPRLARAWCARASLRAKKRELGEAIEDARKAIELAPDVAEAYALRAALHLEGFSYEGARDDSARAAKLDPKSASAWLTHGAAQLAFDQFDEALADLGRAIALEPKNALAYGLRAHVYLMRWAVVSKATADKVKAGDDVRTATELDPDAPYTLFVRGGYEHYAEEKHADALLHYSRALELDPRNADAWAHRAVLKCTALHDVPGALADYDECLRLAPRHPRSAAVRLQRNTLAAFTGNK
jgi:tetratricopeptide (TPR) repeat protein